MSLKESVIIPLQTFRNMQAYPSSEKCAILNSKAPLDVRIKLHDQERLKSKAKYPEDKTVITDEPFKSIDHILQNISEEKRPFIKSILEEIKSKNNPIDWNHNFEVMIDGSTIKGTNIIDIYKFLSKNHIVTRESDVPPGVMPVWTKLIQIGVPKSWISAKIVKQSKRHNKVQKGKGRANLIKKKNINSCLKWYSFY